MVVNNMDPVDVDVAAAQIENAKLNAAAAKPLGERKNVLRRLTQPIQGRDHECVARLKRS